MYKAITANLMVESVEASIAFYRKLGFAEVATVPGETGSLDFAIMLKDGISLMIQERKSLVSEYPSYAADEIRPSTTLYITVDDFDALYEDVRARFDLVADRHTTPYGAEEFALADPDGFILVFAVHQEG